MTPLQRREVDADSVKPCRFLRRMPVAPLLDVASPSTDFVGNRPTTMPSGSRQAKRSPRIAVGRMLKHAAASSDRGERRCEASAILATLVTPTGFNQTSKTAPSRAWGMADDGIVAAIQARISRFIPQVDVGNAGVATVLFNKESRNQNGTSESSTTARPPSGSTSSHPGSRGRS